MELQALAKVIGAKYKHVLRKGISLAHTKNGDDQF
jgi:hypothetical protein